MPPTVFLAFQCCQCSTMQVKQQKKSSNKWTCVVCNQKQSVRKVFAQGFMAKDVRKFVQNFNMSRQFSEQNPILLDENTENLEIGGKQKRTDWTEYIDPGEGEKEESETPNDIYRNPGNELEPKIVTEMPKLVFKKPKLNSYRVAKDCEERNIRSSKSKFQDGESSRHHQEVVRGTQQETGDYASKVKGKFADKQEGLKLSSQCVECLNGKGSWVKRTMSILLMRFHRESGQQ
ncbi:hypothetical protein ACH5RR_034441 [Cinchona calisaya]|uniref:MRN complex-interacting protein N-terminal domain-containing protein n=1 Tax=Cinchona calisaya TaxID=153742 RepID=A0ABD2YEJ0_9GENT